MCRQRVDRGRANTRQRGATAYRAVTHGQITARIRHQVALAVERGHRQVGAAGQQAVACHLQCRGGQVGGGINRQRLAHRGLAQHHFRLAIDRRIAGHGGLGDRQRAHCLDIEAVTTDQLLHV